MKAKILVVDDDKEILTLVKEMLKANGCEVSAVESGEQALQCLEQSEKEGKFDVIFLDLMMPGMSGYQVMEELKKRPETKSTPVIILTARDSGMDMIGGYQIGADYYIPKPFTRSQLAYGIQLVLRGAEEGDLKEPKLTGSDDLEEWFLGKNR